MFEKISPRGWLWIAGIFFALVIPLGWLVQKQDEPPPLHPGCVRNPNGSITCDFDIRDPAASRQRIAEAARVNAGHAVPWVNEGHAVMPVAENSINPKPSPKK